MNLPTKDNLANQMGDIFLKHNNLSDLVLKNYVTNNEMQIYVEENSNHLQSILISKEAWMENNRSTRYSMDSMFDK
jgi:hypothetical protein